MCPSPPRPTTPTFCPLPTFQCRSGEYVVMPAQSSGATPARSRPLGTFNTYFSSTTIAVEYPPYVTPPRILSSPLYVSVKPFQNTAPHLPCRPSIARRNPPNHQPLRIHPSSTFS